MPMIQVVAQTPPPPEVPFDPNVALDAIVPLIGIALVAVVGALALKWFFGSPIGEAIAEGIRLRRRRRWGAEDASGELGAAGESRVAALEHELGLLRGQVSELAERLDFAERMLAERREPRLGAGR